jgi:aminoglycoside phosphotransferase (APT) family kinase protein
MPMRDEQLALLPALQRMGLLRPNQAATFTPLTGGVSSLIVKVQTEADCFCVKRALPQLKVSALWEAPVKRNHDEVRWLKFAHRVAPNAVPDILGEDEQDCVFAMTYLAANEYPVWKQRLLDGHVQPETATSVATLLVALHAASAADAQLCRSFDHDDDFMAIRLSPYFLHAASKHPGVADTLEALVKQTLNHKTALVHGDVSPKNILVGPNGPVLLDAECACFGDPAFDLAFVLTHLMLKCVWRPVDTASYLTSFDNLSGSYLRGVSWESSDLLEARTCLLLAAMLLARIDGKSPVEYLTNSTQQEFVRQHGLRWLQHPPKRLAEMRNLWKPA